MRDDDNVILSTWRRLSVCPFFHLKYAHLHHKPDSAVVYAANSTMDDNIKECVSRLDEMQKNLTTSVVLALLGSSRQATEGVEQLVSANSPSSSKQLVMALKTLPISLDQTKLSEILHAVDAHFLGETPCFDDKERGIQTRQAIRTMIFDDWAKSNDTDQRH